MAMTGQRPQIGVIGDRIAAANGRAMFYTRFFDWCEANRIALDVFGDAPALDMPRDHVRYWPCKRVPHDIASWEGPHAIARRPFLALHEDDAAPMVADELARAVEALARHYEGTLTSAEIAAIDGLSSSWLDPLTDELEAAFARAGIEVLILGTQAFLGFAAARAARRRGIAPIFMIHSNYPVIFHQRLAGGSPELAHAVLPIREASHRRLSNLCYQPDSTVVYRDPTTATLWRAYAALDAPSREVILPPTVDSVLFRPAAEPRSRDRGPLRVLFVGRVELDKDVRTLAELRGLVADVEWTVAGTGPELPWLRDRMPGARFLGHVPHEVLVTEYQRADVFVTPSRGDSMGNAALEAMACGLPVVVSNYGGWTSYVHDERNGLICDRRATSYAHAIERLRDPALRRSYGAFGRAIAERSTHERAYRAIIEAAVHARPLKETHASQS